MADNKYDNGNELPPIPMITADGENVQIMQVDPDLPCGEVSDDIKTEVENEWIEQNYPGKTKEELANMGVSVEFVPGEETYEINGNEVTKEEFDQYQEDHPGLQTGPRGFTENDVTLGERQGIGEDGAWIESGNIHKEPGRIKIVCNADQLEQYVKSELSQEITKEEEEKINEFFQEILGVGYISLQGKSVYDAYNDIVDLVKAEGIKVKNLQIAFVLISLIEDPLIDMVGLKNIWDADDSTLLNVLDKSARVGEIILIFVGATELVTAGASSIIAVLMGIVTVLLDSMIVNKDEYKIFTVKDDGTIMYDFNIPFGSKNMHYEGEIYLDYEDHEHLANQVYAYIVTSKLELLKNLKELEEKRAIIIEMIKSDTDSEMLSLTSANNTNPLIDRNDNKQVLGLCQIYGIQFPLYFSHYANINNFEGIDGTYTGKVKIVVSCDGIFVTYNFQKVDESTPLKSLDDITYHGEFETQEAVVYGLPLPETIAAHKDNYLYSYYSYYYRNNSQAKDDYIDKIANESCVSIKDAELKYFVQLTNHLGENRAIDVNATGKASFMDIGVNEVARNIVDITYESLCEIVENYATSSIKIDELEQELISEWEKFRS